MAETKRPSPAAGKEKKKTSPPEGRKKRTAHKTKELSADIWYAVLLTSSLILVSIVIALVTITIGTNRTANTVITEAAPEPEPVIAVKPVPVAAVIPPKPAPVAAAVEKPAPPPAAPAQVPATAAEPVPAKPVTAAKPQPAPPPAAPEKPAPVAAVPARLATPPEQPPKPRHRGTVAVIIDDAGNNLHELEPFLNFPGPLTIAVLPGLPYSAEAARRIRAAGKELFLHQPMEAAGGQPPGPGAIYSDMSPAEVLEVLRRNIAEIGPVSGMNNHQGSKITADPQAMETVLAFCRDQGIRFLDSRTTAETAVPAAARKMGIKISERNIFIDNEQERAAMSRAIKGGLALAAGSGRSVMIGHVWSPELAALLAELCPELIEQGYSLVTASDLIDK